MIGALLISSLLLLPIAIPCYCHHWKRKHRVAAIVSSAQRQQRQSPLPGQDSNPLANDIDVPQSSRNHHEGIETGSAVHIYDVIPDTPSHADHECYYNVTPDTFQDEEGVYDDNVIVDRTLQAGGQQAHRDQERDTAIERPALRSYHNVTSRRTAPCNHFTEHIEIAGVGSRSDFNRHMSSEPENTALTGT